MYCKKCGENNKDGDTFCKKCGSELSIASYKNNNKQITSGADSVYKSSASIKILIAAICALVMTVFKVVDMVGEGDFISESIREIFSSLYYVYYINAIIPLVIITIALFIIWLQGKKASVKVASGIKLANAAVIWYLVEVIIIAIISIVIGFILTLAGSSAIDRVSEYSDDIDFGSIEGLMWITLLLLIVGFILAIIWYVKILSSTKYLRLFAKGEVSYGNISMYVIVMNWIVVAGLVIGLIGSFLSNSFMADLLDAIGSESSAGFIGIIPKIAKIILVVCTTLSLIELRKEINNPQKISEERPKRVEEPIQKSSSNVNQKSVSESKEVISEPKKESIPESKGEVTPARAPQIQGDDSVTVSMSSFEKPSVGGKIEGILGMYAGAEIPVDAGIELIIGRDESSANIIIKNPKVSRKHCGIRFNVFDGNYIITDYSTNGVKYKNGQKFPKNTPVVCKAGTVIVISDSGNEFILK